MKKAADFNGAEVVPISATAGCEEGALVGSTYPELDIGKVYDLVGWLATREKQRTRCKRRTFGSVQSVSAAFPNPRPVRLLLHQQNMPVPWEAFIPFG